MKYFTAVLFMLILSDAAYSQDYIIKLNPKEDAALKKRNFYFDAVDDAREKNNGERVVGHYGKNNKTTAMLDADPKPFFMDYLSKVYPKRTNDKALTFRINDIDCGSTGGMLSEAKVKLEVDIIDSSTGFVVTNITLEQTHKPLMGGKTFATLIEEIIASGVGMIKLDNAAAH